jgi:hypothetical protein
MKISEDMHIALRICGVAAETLIRPRDEGHRSYLLPGSMWSKISANRLFPTTLIAWPRAVSLPILPSSAAVHP